MAEADYTIDQVEPELPETPDGPLPDDVEPEKTGILIFDLLDEGNLVDRLDDLPGGNSQTAQDALSLLDAAKQSMGPWLRKYKMALKLAKLEPEADKKTFPFDGASNVMMPFIMEAMLDFHSRTTPELVWAKNVVGIKTYGKHTDEKAARADRVSDYMNYQVSEEIPHWRPEQDKMLLQLPCVGTAYKQTYFNGDDQRPSSDLRAGDEVMFDHNYRTFEEAPDKFIEEEFTRNEVITYVRGDEQWRIDEDTIEPQRDHPEPYKFVRAFTWIDMDQDGLTEPYEIIIRVDTEEVVSVYPAYDEESITSNDDGEIVRVEMLKIFTQYRFLPDPEGGPMGMGWGILLSDLFESINTTIRQIIDAGTLANLAGSSGLIDAQMAGMSGRGNRQQAGPIEVRMGELTPITTGGKPLGQSIVQFPYQGPNTTLFQVTEWMLTQVRGMTNSALNMDTNAQEAAVMYLARLQQGLKVPNSIVMRVYDCAKLEFQKLAMLNHKHYNDKKYNRVLDEETEHSMRADFNPDDCDVRLAVDPSQGSDIERQQRATMVLDKAQELAATGAGGMNIHQALVDWLEALKSPNVEQLAPPPSNEPTPMEKAMLADKQRQAELEERDMALREAKQDMERASSMMKALREGADFALQLDKTEAEIAKLYSEAFHKLWEIGAAGEDPIATVENMERRLIDRDAGEAMPQPLESPNPNPEPNPELSGSEPA